MEPLTNRQVEGLLRIYESALGELRAWKREDVTPLILRLEVRRLQALRQLGFPQRPAAGEAQPPPEP